MTDLEYKKAGPSSAPYRVERGEHADSTPDRFSDAVIEYIRDAAQAFPEHRREFCHLVYEHLPATGRITVAAAGRAIKRAKRDLEEALEDDKESKKRQRPKGQKEEA